MRILRYIGILSLFALEAHAAGPVAIYLGGEVGNNTRYFNSANVSGGTTTPGCHP